MSDFHLIRIGTRQLRSFSRRAFHVGHILVFVKIRSLNIELLQIKGILSLFYVVFSVILGSAYNGFLNGIPGSSVASALRCIPESPCNRRHGIRCISPDVEEIIIAFVSRSHPGYASRSSLSLLLNNHGAQHIRIHAGLCRGIHDDVHIAFSDGTGESVPAPVLSPVMEEASIPGPYSTEGTPTTGSSLALTTADGPSRLTLF